MILENLNKEREANGEQLLKNCRNAAAGSVRQLDSSVAAKRNLEVWIYHLPDPEDYGIKTQYESLKFMEELGFRVNPNNRKVKNIDEVLVSVMLAPRTFTAEDTVEINTHGGISPTNKVLELLLDFVQTPYFTEENVKRVALAIGKYVHISIYPDIQSAQNPCSTRVFNF